MNYNNNNGATVQGFGGIMNKVYGLMFLGLLLTAGVSWFVATSPAMNNFVNGSPMTWIILALVELGLVWYLSSRIMDMSYGKAMTMFSIYSVLNGITLSYIFMAYSLGTIYMAFLVTAGTFAAMSAYGYFTKTDLTGIGKILIFALVGFIIATLVNFFMKSSQIDLFISYGLVVVFLGLTAYDTQKIKEIYSQSSNPNIAVLGALTLYLDFINLFIMLLRIFGTNKD